MGKNTNKALLDPRTEFTAVRIHGNVKVGSKRSPATAAVILPDQWMQDFMRFLLNALGMQSEYSYCMVRVHNEAIAKAEGREVKP